MGLKNLILFMVLNAVVTTCLSQAASDDDLSVKGFKRWVVGRDSATQQLMPAIGTNPLTTRGPASLTTEVAHCRFKVAKYGEMSFPINSASNSGETAGVDLSKSRFIQIQYKANHEVVLQLRQTGVHGGIHNHVLLPASERFITKKIFFSSFKGGLKPLDLKDVAKFNFALLGNNPADGFAEVIVRSFKIHRYKPF